MAPLLDNDRRKIELANSLLFTLPGSPIIYYGDEIGMGDNIWLDDRNGVRTPMQWDDSPTAGFTDAQPFTPLLNGDYAPKHVNAALQMANPNSLFHAICHMVTIRKEHHAFGCGSFEWIDLDTNAITGYKRTYQAETMLIFNNLSGQAQTAKLKVDQAINAFTHELVSSEKLVLQPYEYLWLILKTDKSI